MSLTGLLNHSKLSFAEFWAARDARERAMLALAAVVVFSGLFYALLIDPALAGRERLNKNLPVLRQQVSQMRAMAQEAAMLSGKSAAPQIELSKENIEAALAHYRLMPQSVVITGNSAKVQLASVSFAGILDWLGDMQKTLLLSVTEASIVALDRPDMVNATITLRRPSHE